MRLRHLLWSFLLFIAALTAGAQGFVISAPWNPVRGEALALSIAPDGFVIAAGRDAHLWNWRADTAAWTPLAGEGVRVAALSGGRYFAIRKDGELTYFDGLRIEPMGLPALDVTVDREGFPYAIRGDGALVRKTSAAGAWEVIKTAAPARRLAVAKDNAVWIALADGSIARWLDGKYETLPGSARELATGADGTVFAIDLNGVLQRWIAFSRSWEVDPAPENLNAIALNPQSMPWVAAANGAIFSRVSVQPAQAKLDAGIATFDKPAVRNNTNKTGAASNARRSAAAYAVLNPPDQVTDPSPIVWIDTLASAASLAIAARDGSVFALDAGGNIGRWSNGENRFKAFPGQFAKLAIEADGNPWGINSLGRIFRKDANIWYQIRGTASDFSIGVNGQIFATTTEGNLLRYDPTSEGMIPVAGRLFFVTVAPDGVPWGLLNTGQVMRCPTPICQRFDQYARSLAIGPDGSVFIVTLEGELRRLNKAQNDWERIFVLGFKVKSVAVGPRGRPWVVTAENRVYASAYFPRDESADLLEARTTSNQTVGTGEIAPVQSNPDAATPGIISVKNLQFQSIPVPGGAVGLSLGPDGTVIMFVGLTGLIRYDTSKQAFVTVTGYPAGNIRHAKYGPDGKLWIISSDVDGRIYHQLSGSNYETLQLPIPNPQPPVAAAMNRSINIGPDGSVYAIDTVGTLWWRPVGTTTFWKLINGNFANAAVPRAGDVWVIDSNNIVRQIVNGVALRRPSNRNMQANDIAGGQTGVVYITSFYGGNSYPAKWNANNESWDQVSTRAIDVGVAPDGRPWIWDDNNPNVILRAK